jgi:hypothetical protein
MKKSIKIIASLVMTVFLFAACSKNVQPIFDADNGQTLILLTASSATAPTPEVGVTTTEITVQVSTRSTSARTISIAIDPSSTATSDQYSISGLSIPAGEFSGTIVVTSNYDALPIEGSKFLKFSIVSVGSSTLVENGDFSLELFRKCPIVLSEFVGTWSGTGSWSEYFGYTTEIVTTMDGNGDLWMNGMTFQWFQGWWGEVIVTNNPVKVTMNIETEEFVIEEQPYITSTWNGSPQPAYNVKATGKVLNACQKTMVVYPVLVQNGGPIDGTAWAGPFKETIKLD